MKKTGINLTTQYDGKTAKYLSQNTKWNKKSDQEFFDLVDRFLLGKVIEKTRIIEFGCGGGHDLLRLSKYGYKCTGVDASQEMCVEAKARSKEISIYRRDFTKALKLKKYNYELVISKWAMQTAPEIDPIYKNAVKMLKRDGLFIFLVVHPFRQFLEKKKTQTNYFKKEIVQSRIFDQTITVSEPSHTMEEYISPYFTSHFELVILQEGYEFPAAEQIDGHIYPTHLIVVAKKK